MKLSDHIELEKKYSREEGREEGIKEGNNNGIRNAFSIASSFCSKEKAVSMIAKQFGVTENRVFEVIGELKTGI